MASPAPTRLTWTEVQTWPDDGNRYELIDGELHVSAAPNFRHQRVVHLLSMELGLWARANGGQVLTGPFDVYVHEREYVEPDVLFVRADRVALFTERRLPVPPDLVVEVSSPSTRGVDARAKRDLYERFGVPEYWLVDLEREPRRATCWRPEGATGCPTVGLSSRHGSHRPHPGRRPCACGGLQRR